LFSSCIFSHPARRAPSPAASFTTPARKAAWQARARRFEAFHEGGHEGAPIALSAAAIRAVNPPGAPFTTLRCQRKGPDQTAVHALNWR